MNWTAGFLILAALGSTFLAAGCGESDDQPSEANHPRAVVERYQQAIEDQDAAAICREIISPSEPLPRCEEAFSRRLGRAEFQDAVEHELGEVSTDGETARVENLTTGGFYESVKVGGRWYLQFIR